MVSKKRYIVYTVKLYSKEAEGNNGLKKCIRKVGAAQNKCGCRGRWRCYLISCKICKEYYVDDDDEGREELKKFTGKVKELVVKWTNGSHTIKKIMYKSIFKRLRIRLMPLED